MAYISNQHRLAELLLVSGMAVGWAVPVSAQVSRLTLEQALDRARHSKIGVEHAGVQ